MRELAKKSSIKITKTYTGQIGKGTGFGSKGSGGGYIRSAEKVLKEQKANGYEPLRFNPETGKITKA